ncbi:F-box/LRR protein, partial [Trifolium pratense]
WWKICKDPLMWRTIHINDINLNDMRFSFRCLEKICRCAIDLSCGHVEDIAIEFFGTDDLLKYMAHRARCLKRLQISKCSDISNKGLSECVKKFSLLEELDISFDKKISKKSLEDIGRCCPLLKSLNLANKFILEVNFADQLLAILNGCPLLDSLDLQKSICRHQLSPSLVKRCHEQIKDLQLRAFSPDDSDDGLAYVDTFEDTYANEYWEY